jgi:hypothetical protein
MRMKDKIKLSGTKNFLYGFRDNRRMYKAFPAVVLANFSIGDQFGHNIDWSRFGKVPQVVIFAGRDAATSAKDWGVYLQKRFNEGFVPAQDHLQSLSPGEKIKIIAIATLPEVPHIFRGLFRNGFRKESKEMGVGLDFGATLSKLFAYQANNPMPKIAVLPANDPAHTQTEPRVFSGLLSDQSLRMQVEEAVADFLDSNASAKMAASDAAKEK